MTPIIKRLMHKHEDLSLILKQKKPDTVMGVCSPSTKEVIFKMRARVDKEDPQ